jgi:hypothetical protein
MNGESYRFRQPAKRQRRNEPEWAPNATSARWRILASSGSVLFAYMGPLYSPIAISDHNAPEGGHQPVPHDERGTPCT